MGWVNVPALTANIFVTATTSTKIYNKTGQYTKLISLVDDIFII